MSEARPGSANARRPARRAHAASAHGALTVACVAAVYFVVAMFYRVLACWGHPNFPGLLCHIRGNMFGVIVFALVLLVIALAFVAEHDPHQRVDYAQGHWKRPHYVAGASYRALCHPGTPHRMKTTGAGVIWVLLALVFFGILLFGEIAF